VLLTLDDGPDASVTPKILEVLHSYGIQAIFFVVGKRLVYRENRDVLERIVSAGHLVGNNSYTHLDPSQATRDQVSAEIENTQRLLLSLAN